MHLMKIQMSAPYQVDPDRTKVDPQGEDCVCTDF